MAEVFKVNAELFVYAKNPTDARVRVNQALAEVTPESVRVEARSVASDDHSCLLCGWLQRIQGVDAS